MSSRTVTQFESFLYTAGMTDDTERIALADALADPSVGITSVETTAAWNMGSLTCKGADFVAAVKQLVLDVRDVDGNTDGHPQGASALNQLTSAIRTALQAEEEVKRKALDTLGMGASMAPTKTQLFLSPEGGEVLPTSAEIETLVAMEAAVGGYAHLDAFMPTKKVIVHFMRGIKANPVNIQWFDLKYVAPAFEANQKNLKPVGNALTEMTREHSVYDAIEAQPLTRKLAVIHGIKLVMHSLCIASSFIITDRTQYTGPTIYNLVMYNGSEELFYGTRYMVEAVMAEIMKWGDTLTPSELADAFKETMRLTAMHAKERYLMNVAIKMALQESKDEWKAGLRRAERTVATTPPSNRSGPGSTRQSPAGSSSPTVDKDGKQLTVKGKCGPFNRKGGCRYGRDGKCRNGLHQCHICGGADHGASCIIHHPPGAAGSGKRKLEGAMAVDEDRRTDATPASALRAAVGPRNPTRSI